MKLKSIGGMACAAALMFFAGPFGQLVDVINGSVRSLYLLSFTFAAFGVGVIFIIYLIRQYERKQGLITPKTVFVPCAVFLMMYLMASAFR